MTIEPLTIDSIRPRLNENFRLMAATVAGTASLDLTLIEVEDLGDSLSRRAFSLIFAAPPRPVMPQAIYRLENDATGPLEMFLVPLGPERGVFRYQAVFT